MTTDNVLVVDLETTGLDGLQAGDSILSVGIARVDVANRTVSPVFYSPIYQELTDKDRDCWLFRTKHMDPAEITGAPWGDFIVAGIVASIIDGITVTTYNTAFDLDLFLDPWLDAEYADDRPFYFRAPCLMKACDQVEEIPRTVHADYTSWPSLKASYYQLCGGKAGIKMHNALTDAVVAGEIMLALMERGLYDPDREEEYA
jgi:DNA polymerase III epsilon subunit-like protein